MSTIGASKNKKRVNATGLFVDVMNDASLAEKLTDAELSEIILRLYSNAGDTAHLFDARHLQFVGRALLSIFVYSADTLSVNHALRAARSALGIVDADKQVDIYLQSRFANRCLCAFGVCVALHSGPVAPTGLQEPLHGETRILPAEDANKPTFLLQQQAALIGWSVIASVSMLRGITEALKTGGLAMFSLLLTEIHARVPGHLPTDGQRPV